MVILIYMQCLSHETIFPPSLFCAPFADIQFWYQAAAALEHWVAEMSSNYIPNLT